MEAMLDMAVAALPILKTVFSAIGLILVIIGVVIKITPSTADDEKLAAIKQVPLLGGLLAYLVGKSPVAEKSEG